MANTTDREVAHKHRVKKRKWTAKQQAMLANAKKKTLIQQKKKTQSAQLESGDPLLAQSL